MQNIEEMAFSNYETNMRYFKKNHETLYNKLIALDTLISDGRYSQKYELEYKDEYFDILDIESKSYFYKQNSLDHAKNIADNVSFKKDEATIETFYNIVFDDEDTEILDSLSLLNNDMGAIAPIVNYTHKNSYKLNRMQRVSKFIFFGTALALHIPQIMEKVKSSHILIIEDDLELFKLSLFTVDYGAIFQNYDVVFSIQENNTTLHKYFTTFISKGFLDSNYIKYSLLADNYLDKIKTIQNFIVSQDFLTYPYYKLLARDIFAPTYIAKRFNFINFKKKIKKSLFSSKPTIVISAGPSLDKNIEWLRKHKYTFTIICVLAATKTLIKNGITPHIVISIDYTAGSLDFLDNQTYSALENSIFLFCSYVPEPLVNLFSKDKVFFFEQGVDYKKDHITLHAPSVGETSYAVSLLLGAKEIYLLGLDLALDQETGMTHAKDHIGNRKLAENEPSNKFSILQSTLYIKGNFIQDVKTLSVMNLSVQAFKALTSLHKKSFQKVYNLSNGAYLEEAIPLHIEDIELKNRTNLDFTATIKSLQKEFSSISSSKASKEERNILKDRINEASHIKKYLLAYSKVEINTLEDFSQSLSLIIVSISLQEDKSSHIRGIFTYYNRMVIGYISAFFNTADLTDKDYHAKQINTILTKQFIKIIDYYIEGLNKHLERY